MASHPITETKYTGAMPRLCRIMCARAGLTVKDLAACFKVAPRTFIRWMHEHPELREAVESGRIEFDNDRVKGALLKRALGYEFTETTREPGVETLEDGSRVSTSRLVVTKKVKKHLPPDVNAIMRWLTNRDPERWKDKLFIEDSESPLEDALERAKKRLEGLKAHDRGIERCGEVEAEQGLEQGGKSDVPDSGGE